MVWQGGKRHCAYQRRVLDGMVPKKPLPVDNSLRAYLELLFLDFVTSVQPNGHLTVLDMHLFGTRVTRRELRSELEDLVVKEFELPSQGQTVDWDPPTVDVVGGVSPRMAAWGVGGVFVYSDGRLVHMGGCDSFCAEGVAPGSIALVNVPSCTYAMPTQGYHRGYWFGLIKVDNDLRRILGETGYLLAHGELARLLGLPAAMREALRTISHRAQSVGCAAKNAYDHLDA